MSGNPTLAGLIAVALSLPGIPAAHAQQPSPGAVQVQGADLELIGEVRGVAGRLESVRGAKVPRLPLAVRATGAERESAASARALAMLPADRLAARGRAWQSLGQGTSATPSAVLRLLAEDLEGIGLDAEGR